MSQKGVFYTRFASVSISEVADLNGRRADIITIETLAYGATVESERLGDSVIVVREPAAPGVRPSTENKRQNAQGPSSGGKP